MWNSPPSAATELSESEISSLPACRHTLLLKVSAENGCVSLASPPHVPLRYHLLTAAALIPTHAGFGYAVYALADPGAKDLARMAFWGLTFQGLAIFAVTTLLNSSSARDDFAQSPWLRIDPRAGSGKAVVYSQLLQMNRENSRVLGLVLSFRIIYTRSDAGEVRGLVLRGHAGKFYERLNEACRTAGVVVEDLPIRHLNSTVSKLWPRAPMHWS